MGETANKEAVKKSEQQKKKKSVFKTLKAEFKKIIWPDKQTLGKKTTATIVVSVCLGALIALIDLLFKTGINLIIH
jgi:preprotein translocase subunit SecE